MSVTETPDDKLVHVILMECQSTYGGCSLFGLARMVIEARRCALSAGQEARAQMDRDMLMARRAGFHNNGGVANDAYAKAKLDGQIEALSWVQDIPSFDPLGVNDDSSETWNAVSHRLFELDAQLQQFDENAKKRDG